MSDRLPIIDCGPSERGWSYYSTILRCPQLFFWRYVATKTARNDGRLAVFSDYTDPLARGSIFHVGLAHWYAKMWAEQNGKDPNLVAFPIDAMNEMARRIGDIGAEMAPIAISMFQSYVQRYPVETFQVVAIEQPAEIQFNSATLGPIRYTARIDLVVKEQTGRIFVYDHKTTARLEGKSVRRYSLNGQIFGLAALGRSLYGAAFGGVVINHASEDGQFLRKPPEPAPWMARKFEAGLVIVHAAEMIDRLMTSGGDDPDAWPANPSDQTCFGPYGICPAFDLCKWGMAT